MNEDEREEDSARHTEMGEIKEMRGGREQRVTIGKYR